jgi:hypothetical protein
VAYGTSNDPGSDPTVAPAAHGPVHHRPPPRRRPASKPYHPRPGTPRRYGIANDPWAAYRQGPFNSAYDQATQIVEQFLQIMGWPSGIDAVSLTHQLLTQNLELSPMQSFNYLFGQLPSKFQSANPNAEFGLTRDAYVGQLNALKDSFDFFTGSSDIPQDVLRMAIDQGWTQNELLDFLKRDARYSDPAKLPWLQQGMGYRDVRNQFVQIYGKGPTNPEQLASWFNFRQGAQQVGQAPAATVVGAQGPQRNTASQSEIR